MYFCNMKTIIEIWKEIPGFETQYEVSNFGRVRSMNRNIQAKSGLRLYKGKMLKSYLRDRYISVCLYKSTVPKNHLLHRLVAIAFIPNSDNLPQVNHKDLDKSNNNVWNLEWSSCSDNINHYHRLSGKKSSKYSGVSWCKREERWQAGIKYNGKNLFLGSHILEEEAHKAFESAKDELERTGVISYRNFRKYSLYKGVCYDKRRNHWIANIIINGKTKYLGKFSSAELASESYNKAKADVPSLGQNRL